MPIDTSLDNAPKVDEDEILAGLLEWVQEETPSDDAVAVNRLADQVQTLYQALGTEIERTPGRDGFGDHLRIRTPGHDGSEPGLLVLSHMDTVHPHGTKAEALTIRREGDIMYGPGIYDMKSGAFLPYYAYRHMLRSGTKPNLPVTFMLVSEEEVGSPTSRALIEEEARKAKYVLVTEPARDGGKVVTARKGVARFELAITGRPSHSGVNHDLGRSAIRELARQILDIEGMTDYTRGVTTNVGLISGGTGVNVVPRDASATIDMRVTTVEDGETFSDKVLAIKPYDPDVTIEISGGMNRPPFEASEGTMALFEIARSCAADVGIDLEAVPMTGGGSDGNFTAALGVPTLDGLGADGRGAHTLEEQIYISSLAPRARMWVRLFETLE
jgi:glutamate carboxypeptidase